MRNIHFLHFEKVKTTTLKQKLLHSYFDQTPSCSISCTINNSIKFVQFNLLTLFHEWGEGEIKGRG
jgi:hypothetical protein